MPDRPEIITSTQNAKLKALIALRDRKEREATGLCLVEGAREIQMAAENGYEIETLYFCRSEFSGNPGNTNNKRNAEARLRTLSGFSRQVFELGDAAFEKAAMREGRDGLMATVKTRTWTWNDLGLGSRQSPPTPTPAPAPLFLAAQNIEKPGNLGALLRTAEAAGVTALVTLDAKVDVWNPNAIRASLGCVFRIPVIQQTSADFVAECAARGITTVAAALTKNSRPHYEVAMTGPTAIVMGSEAWGLTEWWLAHAAATAMIPMRGKADSLNVSVAAGILVFEALRQRGSGDTRFCSNSRVPNGTEP